MHKRPQFAAMFPMEFAPLPEHLFCLVSCLGSWKECVSTADEPCKRPLRDARSCAAPSTGLTSFMNKLSSLFRTLLALASHRPCSPKALKWVGFNYEMWERKNLQIWAPIQSLRAAKCHGRANAKQVKKNRCVSYYTSVTFTVKFKLRWLTTVTQSWDYFTVMYCSHDASFPSETHPSFPLCQLNTKHFYFYHIYSHETASALGVTSVM